MQLYEALRAAFSIQPVSSIFAGCLRTVQGERDAIVRASSDCTHQCSEGPDQDHQDRIGAFCGLRLWKIVLAIVMFSGVLENEGNLILLLSRCRTEVSTGCCSGVSLCRTALRSWALPLEHPLLLSM